MNEQNIALLTRYKAVGQALVEGKSTSCAPGLDMGFDFERNLSRTRFAGLVLLCCGLSSCVSIDDDGVDIDLAI